MILREATPDDWFVIWPVVEEVVRAGETYAYPTDLSSEQARGLWMERPPGRTVVVEREHGNPDDAVLGTAKMGPNRPGPGSHIGTASFMVAGHARGRGVGRRLGEEVVAWHRQQGYRGIQFNAVVETNTAAVFLWRSLGFVVVGTVPGAFRLPRGEYVGLHVMYLDLTG